MSLTNQNWDIDRTGPRALHIGLNKPEYNLSNDDIGKSKPQFQKFKTKRVVNPMNPNYSLPKVELVEVDPPKFIRDHISNEDIEGAQPKKPKYFATREIMRVGDIEGTKSKPYPKRSTKYSSLDYSDVTKTQFKSQRMTNPLNPSYFHKVADGQIEEIGNIEGSKPKEERIRKRGPNALNLNVQDIDGTKVGSKGLRAFKNFTRREYRETNKISDIDGAQIGSLLKAPITNRIVNPLNPVYPILGAKELAGNFNPYAENTASNENRCSTAPVKTRKDNLKREKIEKQPNLDKEVFKRDIGKFYSTTPGFMQEVDFKKISGACKPPVAPKPIKVSVNLKDKKEFNRDAKKFYGAPLSEKSEYSLAKNAFYGTNSQEVLRPNTEHTSSRKQLTTHQIVKEYTNSDSNHWKTTTDLHEAENKQHFKKDAANFYAESYKSSEKGSIFQDNAAVFYDMPKPPHGEKIINPSDLNPKMLRENNKSSVLNERKLKAHELNMQRHPMFGKNLKRFYGMKSAGKIDCFIQ